MGRGGRGPPEPRASAEPTGVSAGAAGRCGEPGGVRRRHQRQEPRRPRGSRGEAPACVRRAPQASQVTGGSCRGPHSAAREAEAGRGARGGCSRPRGPVGGKPGLAQLSGRGVVVRGLELPCGGCGCRRLRGKRTGPAAPGWRRCAQPPPRARGSTCAPTRLSEAPRLLRPPTAACTAPSPGTGRSFLALRTKCHFLSVFSANKLGSLCLLGGNRTPVETRALRGDGAHVRVPGQPGSQSRPAVVPQRPSQT